VDAEADAVEAFCQDHGDLRQERSRQ
jgi:hypothetical protein